MLARAEEEYPLSIPQPGWAEQDPEDWWRATRGGARRRRRGRDRSGSRARCTGSSCSTPPTACCGPAILWNDQRTGAECAEIEETVGFSTARRADREPRAARVHRAEARLGAQARARGVGAGGARAPAEGLRPAAADRRAGDRRGRGLGDAALRRRRPAVVGGGVRRARDPDRSGCRRRTSRRRSAAPATSRRARSASASSGPGRCRSCSARRASSSRHCDGYRADPEARVHVFCHAVPDTWEAMGVMLSAAGLPEVAARRGRRVVRRARRRGGALACGHRGADLPAVPPGRADAACRPVRSGHVRGTVPPT